MIEVTGKTAMLARPQKEDDSFEGWLLEPKFDGHRIIAQVTEDGARIYARTGVDKTGRLPAIEAELVNGLSHLPPGTTLDGEVVKLRPDGTNDWSAVQSVLGSKAKAVDDLTFVIFDVLSAGDTDVRSWSITERRNLLELLFPSAHCEHVQLSPQAAYTVAAVEKLIEDGWEGAILKDPDGRYKAGRSGSTWVKIKAQETTDVVVMGATEGKGRFDGQIGALVFGQYVGGELRELGQCSGMDDAERLAFTHDWLDGRLKGTVIEIKHYGQMASGGLRHPQFLRVRTDKLAEDCVPA